MVFFRVPFLLNSMHSFDFLMACLFACGNIKKSGNVTPTAKNFTFPIFGWQKVVGN